MSAEMKVLSVLAVLCLASVIYAIVLDKHPRWYLPDRTWIAVVIGVAMIGAALWAIELWGVPLTIGHVVLADCAAGAPIIVWQLIQVARRGGEIAGRQNQKGDPHGPDSGRSPGR